MSAQLPPRTLFTFCSLGLLMTMLSASRELHAESCCRVSVPEVRFLANTTVPAEGHLDLHCVSRRMNADSALADIALLLRENPTITLCLVGHADNAERDVEALSLQRARRIACELVSTYGIEAGRLTTEGRGASQPRIDERWLARMPRKERDRGRTANRRVEFRVMDFDWTPQRFDGIAAARFLSDPAPPSTSAHTFCDAPMACADIVEAPDTMTLIETQDTMLITVSETAALATEDPSAKPEALAPMITPNPIISDELNIVWLPETTQELSIRLMTVEGRLIGEQRTMGVAQGTRLKLPFTAALVSGAYILRISTEIDDWSLRFVKQ